MAISKANADLVPASRNFIDTQLSMMAVTQAHKSDDENTAALKMRIYGNRLRKYPQDAVAYACGLTRKWFPTWAELETDLETAMGGRQARLEWLQSGVVVSHEQQNVDQARKALDAKMARLIIQITDHTKYGRRSKLAPLVLEYENKARPRHLHKDSTILKSAKAIIEGGVASYHA